MFDLYDETVEKIIAEENIEYSNNSLKKKDFLQDLIMQLI